MGVGPGCRRLCALAAVALWGAGGASVHAAPQELTVPRVTARSAGVTSTTALITIDGVLDEPIWRSAPTIGELVQRQPDTGAPPTERTDVTLLRDDNHLYIGVVAYDSEPGRVIGTQMAHDASLSADDRIEVLLDTFRDQRSAFYFATNPAGALVDGLAFSNGQLNTEWDAIWQVRTGRTDQGWVAEFAIPFKSLSFPAGQDSLGLQHLADDLPEARGEPLVGRAAADAVPAGLRGRRGHQPRRAHAGHRPRHSPVPRRAVAAPRRQRRQRVQPQAGPRPVLQPHAEPQADGDVQHGFRRDGSGRPPDQPDPVLAALSREAVVLP